MVRPSTLAPHTATTWITAPPPSLHQYSDSYPVNRPLFLHNRYLLYSTVSLIHRRPFSLFTLSPPVIFCSRIRRLFLFLYFPLLCATWRCSAAAGCCRWCCWCCCFTRATIVPLLYGISDLQSALLYTQLYISVSTKLFRSRSLCLPTFSRSTLTRYGNTNTLLSRTHAFVYIHIRRFNIFRTSIPYITRLKKFFFIFFFFFYYLFIYFFFFFVSICFLTATKLETQTMSQCVAWIYIVYNITSVYAYNIHIRIYYLYWNERKIFIYVYIVYSLAKQDCPTDENAMKTIIFFCFYTNIKNWQCLYFFFFFLFSLTSVWMYL